MSAPVLPLETVKVLVVDDHPDILELASGILTGAGASVSASARPFGAEDLLLSEATDVLVTDILMPGCDGFELLRVARGAGYSGGAVAMTAADRRIVERTLREGFARCVRKPIEPQALVAAVQEARNNPGLERAPERATVRPLLLRGVRVLLVEDHVDTLRTYAEGLRQLGAEVMTATTAQMGLMVLERRVPHVLVVDIGLPDVDGNDFLLKVRSRRPRPGWDTPAIALTAYNSLQDRLRTVDAGFRLHVPKPVEPAYLGGLVAELARGRT